MYADDSIMCCLFPNRCNLFPPTPKVIFSNTMEDVNMIVLLCASIAIVWSLLRIVLQFVEKKEMIEEYDSEDSCLEEQLLQKEVQTKCTDESLSNENKSDGSSDNPCSDSDLNVSNSFKRRHEKLDTSTSDCFNSNLEPSEEIFSIDMTNRNRRSCSSLKRSVNSSSSDDREDCNHIEEHLEKHNIKIAAMQEDTLTILPEEQVADFLPRKVGVSQEDTNACEPKDTLPVTDTDSINQQQLQNKPSDHSK